MRVDIGIPPVILIDSDDVGGIGNGQRAVAFNDHQVVVVFARSLEAEIVRARHDNRVRAEGVEHDHFAMDVNAGPENFRRPVVELLLDICRDHRSDA